MDAERKAKPPRGASPLFGTVPFFPVRRHTSPHGQITAVSMMKDEGPYVLEWVAHHLCLGFTDLVVYTNDCSDGTDDMLIRLEELGLAHHRRNVIPQGIRPQPSALNHAQDEPVVCQSDWVMVFDADEFLSIRHGDGTLDALIGSAVDQQANGVVVTWRIFGSGGVVEWSRDPVTEQYLMAAPPDWNKGWGVKTLFKFDPEYWKLGIHRPKMKNRHIDTPFPDTVKWLNGSGRPMEDYFKFRGWRSITRTVGYDWVQLNHYAVKSVDSYAIRKLRGNVNNKKDKYNSDYWSLQDRNEVRDETMLRYTGRRNAMIAALLADPVLHRLHHTAIERAEARLSEIRATSAYADLVADLARASAVPLGQIVAKPPQARDREKIAALMSDVEKRRNAKARADRKENPPDKVAPPPMVSYLTRIDAPTDTTLDWTANHAILLPQDPRVFTTTALGLIAAGKFERGLARRMPQVLPKAATVTIRGAGCGFLACHLARLRPDLALSLTESDTGLHPVLRRVAEKNTLPFTDRFRFFDSGTPADSTVLLLADPAFPPAALATLPPATDQLYLLGRFLEAGHDPAQIEAAINAAGFVETASGFDPALTRAFIRPGT